MCDECTVMSTNQESVCCRENENIIEVTDKHGC